MSNYNQDLMDSMAIVSFLIGIANYNENLSQSDKDDIMQKLDEQTKVLLEHIEQLLEEQNKMLKAILEGMNELQHRR